MDQQKLSLVIEKGPRSGETLEFLPTNPPIKLGRVVRGNSLPIKDPGISTKHLTIEFQSNNWVITDLDSSNGTVVNNAQLKAFVPKVLAGGDCVRVGEVTVIRVLISCGKGENEGDLGKKGPRGGLRRGKAVEEIEKESGLGLGVEFVKKGPGGLRTGTVVEENVGESELGLGVELGKKGPRGGLKKGKVVEEIEEKSELGLDVELGRKGPRGRGKAVEKIEEESVHVELGKKGPRGGLRRGKAVEKIEEESVHVELGKKGPRGGLRRGKAVEKIEEESVHVELGKKGPRGGLRRGKVVEEIEEESELEKKVTRGRPRRGKIVEENVCEIVEDVALGSGEELGKKVVVEEKRVRGRPKKEEVEIFTENMGRVENVQGKRQVGTSKNLSNLSEDVGVGVVDEVFEKKAGRGKGRRGKEKANEDAELCPVKVEPCPQVSTRRTRSVRVVENKENVKFEAVKIAEKGKARTSKRKLGSEEGNCSEKGNVINVQSGNLLNSERVVVKSEPRESFCEVDDLGNDSKEEERGEEGNGSGLGQEERVKASGFEDREAPDFEKMTVGEYFDYLEVALPKQIIEETEIIIEEMHKKAEIYREFVREHQDKGNNKLHVG